MQTYRNEFDANTQISAEEKIAAAIFGRLETAGCENGGTLTEQDCSDLGRDILRQVLEEFRPDLFTEQTDQTTAPGVPLLPDQIASLRNALNLAAEYKADIDDPQYWDENDMQKLNATIESFRKLDDYLKQFEPKEQGQ